jgi:hypothetical protein
MTFIGVGVDVQVASYTFAYLDRTVRRLCSNYMKYCVNDSLSNRNRELMRQSYYLGAVSTINSQMVQQKVQTPVTPGALVPIKEGLIKKAISELGPIRTVRGRRSYINSHAYNQGQTDGKNVRIHKGVAGQHGSKALPK